MLALIVGICITPSAVPGVTKQASLSSIAENGKLMTPVDKIATTSIVVVKEIAKLELFAKAGVNVANLANVSIKAKKSPVVPPLIVYNKNNNTCHKTARANLIEKIFKEDANASIFTVT